MNISKESIKTLLVQLHKSIEDSANSTANQLNNGQVDWLINYPPNGGLTESEKSSLDILKNNTNLRNALRKVLASNSASVLFELFSIIDGVSDPDPNTGKWSEIMFVDKPDDFDEHRAFLHDQLYETYWDWRKKRQADFKLDLLDD